MAAQNFFTSGHGIYYGTENDLKTSFELKHNDYPIFKRVFDASDSSIVSIASSTIKIENHFFVTGEKVTYSSGNSSSSAIGIQSEDFGPGIGVTNKLPNSVYIIKVDENTIKLAKNSQDALRTLPISLNISSVGVGSQHSFTSTNQNAKVLVAIDNVIQSPIVSTSTTSYLSSQFLKTEDILYSDSILNFFIGDYVKINNEIMQIEDVGVGSTNSIRVLRPKAGTNLENHSIGSTITKLSGNYNIVENTINFVEAPYGNIPLSTSTNPPNERDWEGISMGSYFHGRTFMRSGVKDTANESYYKNFVFDDISNQFNGKDKSFILTSSQTNVTDIYQQNGVILINDVFQGPGLQNNYTMDEVSGITSVSFVGAGTSNISDINTSDFPSGGILVSIGSTAGLGYQPLVSAGATVIIAVDGTISAVSIGNSGSGYRSEIKTSSGSVPITVRVGVISPLSEESEVEYIGEAVVSNGNIANIIITNVGSGYTSSNPPSVVIDPPISYSNIPLIYSSTSSGIGTQATIDVVVGQGSSVIEYEIKNLGYGYKVGEVLTIPTGGTVGIPTISNSIFKEFKITVDQTFIDKFSGWTLGELQPLDNIQKYFDGKRSIFPLLYLGSTISIYARKGSPINIQDTLLVFINDIIQIPGEGYVFNGGSKIRFTEAPKPDDTCKIIFYKGSGDGVDVVFRDIVETVKVGDDLTLTYDPNIGQSPYLLEDPRIVYDILSINSVETNPYFGPGNTTDETLDRPITWCRQTEDLIINGQDVTKDRTLYEPQIFPSSYLIQPVGVGTSVIFVDNIRPFFNPFNENDISLDFQKNVTIISQDAKVSASATAVVSAGGTISSIIVNDGGFGYESSPIVSIQSPPGISSITSTAVASITSGIVTSISITGVVTGYSQQNPPFVLIEPPTASIELDRVVSYTGDSGVILGVNTAYNGTNNQLVFDLYIPQDSFLRDSLLTETPLNTSSLSVGDFFVVYNSNVGVATTSFDALGLDSSIVGSANQFVDSVYQVESTELTKLRYSDIGVVDVVRVFSNVSSGIASTTPTCTFTSIFTTFDSTSITFDDDINTFDSTISNTNNCTLNIFGNYSWGKITLRSRSKDIIFNSYTSNGIVGITTSALVSRTSPLKYKNYAI